MPERVVEPWRVLGMSEDNSGQWLQPVSQTGLLGNGPPHLQLWTFLSAMS